MYNNTPFSSANGVCRAQNALTILIIDGNHSVQLNYMKIIYSGRSYTGKKH